jgi:hypothetical protein
MGLNTFVRARIFRHAFAVESCTEGQAVVPKAATLDTKNKQQQQR